MSRSKKAPWVVDGSFNPRSKHKAKKAAARKHRHAENVRIKVEGDLYLSLPSIVYTNPWDISDYRYSAKDCWTDKPYKRTRK